MQTSEKVRELLLQTQYLTDQLTQASFLYNANLFRVGISATATVKESAGGETVSKEDTRFLNFFNSKTIPPEFKTFLNDYANRLAAERLMIWAELEKLGHKIQ